MAKMYDCVIIGAGIAGTMSALILAKVGLQVLVVEAGAHPRFAIGESFLPTTTLGCDYLARTYGTPELRQISHYPELKEIGCAGWPKLGFWFGHHRAGLNFQAGHELMFVSPGLPIGPDVHVLRADVDSFLVAQLSSYGVDYHDRTCVTEVTFDSTGVELILEATDQRLKVHSRFVLDCSGHKSFLAARLGLRLTPPPLRTNTRTIYAHFQNVLFLEEVLGKPAGSFRTNRNAGTVHHCFEGGWFWVIRFDNHISSIGLVLDRDLYPDNNLPAAEEFGLFLSRFPMVEAHLGSATPIRPFVKTGRIQFSSHTIAGDRFLLTPHAASFVDPLFSTGVDLTTAFITRMMPILQRMMVKNDFRFAHLEPLQSWYANEINSVDQIIHGMYRSFRHVDIFKQYWRAWIFISLAQYFTQFVADPLDGLQPLGHYGASFQRWQTQLEKMYQWVKMDTESPANVAATLKAMMDDFPEPFAQEQTNWNIGSTEPCCPTFNNPVAGTEWFGKLLATEPALAARVQLKKLDERQQRLQQAHDQLVQRYLASKMQGTAYHQGVDFILAQQH